MVVVSKFTFLTWDETCPVNFFFKKVVAVSS